MLENIKNRRGSSTIEAALVMSILLMIIITVIYGLLLLYQKSLLVKSAAAAAQQGAEIWADLRRYDQDAFMGDTKKLSLSELYQQLFDFSRKYEIEINILEETEKEETGGSLQDQKLQKIRHMACSGLERGLLKPEISLLEINFSNKVLERKIEVTITQEVKVPLGAIKSFFDGKNTVTLKGIGTAVVAEPDEYIRNIDLGLEYSGRALEALSVEKKIKEFKDKLFGGR